MHQHAKPAYRALILAAIFTAAFALIEAAGGWWGGSLALLGDAGHMITDSLALATGAFAAWIAEKPPSSKHTFGLGRAEVIAAWISSLIMFSVSIAIIIESIERIENPPAVKGGLTALIAFVGLIVNLLIISMLSHKEKTLNVRAALLHVMGDVLGSLAALVSGAIIYFSNWLLIDPVLSIFIAILILLSSIQLLKESLTVLMEGVPHTIDIEEVKKDLSSLKDVYGIHDLHIWTLSSGKIMLSAHIDIEDLKDWNKVLSDLTLLLHNKHGIEHVTLQPELTVQKLQYHHKK